MGCSGTAGSRVPEPALIIRADLAFVIRLDAAHVKGFQRDAAAVAIVNLWRAFFNSGRSSPAAISVNF